MPWSISPVPSSRVTPSTPATWWRTPTSRRRVGRDPGELFDWARLARAGIGLWPEQGEGPAQEGPVLRQGANDAAVRRQQERLREIGYGIVADGDFGATTAAVVRAFQRHFRQARVDGVIDGDTAAVLDRVGALVAGGAQA